MGLLVDAITGRNLLTVVQSNIDGAFDATEKSIPDFVDLVIKKIKNDKITALRIWGHGITHYRDESDYPNGNVIFGPDNLNAETIDTFRPSLERLKEYFAQSARAELRGCQPGKGSGKEMMKKLAKIWNVDVYGSERSQFLVTWNPPVYVATPGGGFGVKPGIEVFEKR